MIKKCRELNAEIVANAAKIQTALRLSLQDQNSITLLKKEIDKAWKMVDGAQDKEKRARETIQRLKGEMQHLGNLVDRAGGLSIGQENAVNDLLKVKENLTKEVENAMQKVEEGNRSLEQLQQEKEEKEVALKKSETEIKALMEKNAKTKNEWSRENRRADRLQAEMLVPNLISTLQTFC